MIEQHDSLAEKFVKKWIWLYIFSFLVAPIWYIIKIILSQDLSVEEIWIIYWVMSLMVLLNSFNDLWMSESLNKFIPNFVTQKRYDKVKTIITYALIAQIITWWIIFLVFYFLANFLAMNYFDDEIATNIIKIFSFFFLWTTFFHVINVFFQSIQDTFYQKITEFLRMLFILWFTIYMFFNNLGNIFYYSASWVLWLYFWIIISIFLFFKKYYLPYLKNEKILWDKSIFKEIFSYALLVFLWSQASTILSQIDMQMIIYMLWNKDAWYYTNYLSIVSIPFVLIWPVFAFLFPVFSELIAKKDFEKIKLIKSIFTKNFLSFSLAFSILLFVFWEVVSVILFTDKFLISWIILKYSVLFISFNFLLQINFNILAANWKIKERLKIILIAIVFNSILNYILIKYIWVAWASLATWLWWLLIYVLSEIKLKEYFTHFDIKYLVKNILVFSFIWSLLYIFIVPHINWLNNRLLELIYLVIVWIVYFIVYFLVNIWDFKYFYQEIKKIKK